MSTQSPDAPLSLPSGGGALTGLGETFAPDPFTGTAGASVPLPVPPGRGGLQPALGLQYAAGQGNGPFGAGWALSVPGVARRTEKGLPRYRDAGEPDDLDTFVLSGAEALVPVGTTGEGGLTVTRYRPRTEGLFARIEHVTGVGTDYWRVRTTDGTTSVYGPPPDAHPGAEPATEDPDDPRRRFAWHLARTEDVMGNRVEYEYMRGADAGPEHAAVYLKAVRYDAWDEGSARRFLHSVTFVYDEDRPDPFSDFRGGFEVRVGWRCRAVEARTHAALGGNGPVVDGYDAAGTCVQTLELGYADEQGAAPANGVSLLAQLQLVGHADGVDERMPALALGYSGFDPGRRRFEAVEGPLPGTSLADPTLALVDLDGRGMPDLVQLAAGAGAGPGLARRWPNLGGGRFGRPQPLRHVPPVGLDTPGVRLLDADGDGLPDVMVADGPLAGTFPLRSDATPGAPVRIRRYDAAPSLPLTDPSFRLMDLTGDGVTDALRSVPTPSGSALALFYHDAEAGWTDAERVRSAPPVDLADPRARAARLSGAPLADLAAVRRSRIEVWPHLGYGRFGAARSMPLEGERLPSGFDPSRVLLGDLDGDGLDDLAYVEDDRVTVWFNRAGNAFGNPVTLHGIPRVPSQADLRLVDLLGTGTAGLLVSREAGPPGRPTMWFLDLTGGVKPYLLTEMENGLGATTRMRYRPSTAFRLADEADPATRWTTPLPMPVQVVAEVETEDAVSGGTLVQAFAYHHGYWDGREREFRGFGRVDRRDVTAFELPEAAGPFASVETAEASAPAVEPLVGAAAKAATAAALPEPSPPVEVRTWFHLGGVAEADGGVRDGLFEDEYWSGDAPALAWGGGEAVVARAAAPAVDPVRAAVGGADGARDALRALRGTALRSETYARDGSAREHRPYTVTEQVRGVRLVEPLPGDGAAPFPRPIVFPFALASRTTEWDRGDDPHTVIQATAGIDLFGRPARSVSMALPRGGALDAERVVTGGRISAGERVLASRSETDYATPDGDAYLHAHVCRSRAYEVRDSGEAVLPADGGPGLLALACAEEGPAGGELLAETLTYYDGAAYQGRPWGEVGPYGLPTRTEALHASRADLTAAFAGEAATDLPPYLRTESTLWSAEYPELFRDDTPDLAGFVYLGDPEVAPPPGTPPAPQSGGYYAVGGRTAYDHHLGEAPHGLPRRTLDALGVPAELDYDAYRRLPVAATAGDRLTTTAAYDYRTLQPTLITDPNGDRAAAGYTPLGLVAWTAALGIAGEDTAPVGGADTVASPGVRYTYDLLAFAQGRGPASVRTERRVHRATATDVTVAALGETISAAAYSDGFGRVVQTRTQADDEVFGSTPFYDDAGLPPVVGAVPGDARPVVVPNAVTVSGFTVYDDKGRPVEAYEPFTDTGLAFQTHAPQGQAVRTVYDARGRAVRTRLPDGAETRVVFGLPADLAAPDAFVPSPWLTTTYDANDNAGRTHPGDAEAAEAAHLDTPATATVDALGRVVEERQRLSADPADDVVTRFTYDLRGNRRSVIDPLGRITQTAAYARGGGEDGAPVLRTWHHEGGTTRVFYDAGGVPVETRGADGTLALASRDALGRPHRAWARDPQRAGHPDEPTTLRARTVFGDDPAAFPDQADAAARRLRGVPREVYDEAGVAEMSRLDVGGQATEARRRVVRDAVVLAPVEASVAAGLPAADWVCDWTPAPATPTEGQFRAHAGTLLEATPHETTARFDALGRPRWTRLPVDADAKASLVAFTYSRGGGIATVTVDGEAVVTKVGYSARGERLFAAYGNGLMTRQAFHPGTRRLARLRTERFATLAVAGGPDVYTSAGGVVQDTSYGHDLSGNVTHTWEKAPGSGIPAAPNGIHRVFSYDALYRLTRATGREAATAGPQDPWATAAPRGALLPDPADTRVYVRLYDYTKASAVERLRHRAIGESGHDFTRTFEVPTASSGVNAGLPLDRLSRITVASTVLGSTPDYGYDGLGQLVREGTARHTAWSASGKPRSFRVQVEHADGTAAAPSVYARYLYDGEGTRIRKVTRQQDGGGLSETALGGVRLDAERDATGTVIRTESTTSLPEGFEVRGGTAHADDGRPAVRQRLMDRNGSAVLTLGAATLDGARVPVSREEYFPYGETALGGAVRASARFDGKRRDAESGMYDYGLRTYAAWTCRFTSVDPLAGKYPELSTYGYAGGRPVTMTDALGAEPAQPLGTSRSASSSQGTVQDDPQDPDERVGLYVIHVHAGEVFDVRFYKHHETLYAVAEYPSLSGGEVSSQRPDWSGFYGNVHDGESYHDPYVVLGEPPASYRMLDPDSMEDYNTLRAAVAVSASFETSAYQAEVASPSAWSTRGAGSLFISGSIDNSFSIMTKYAVALVNVAGGVAAVGRYGIMGLIKSPGPARYPAGLRGRPPSNLRGLMRDFDSLPKKRGNANIAHVEDSSELRLLWERWSANGRPAQPAGSNIESARTFRDGTKVDFRLQNGNPYAVTIHRPVSGSPGRFETFKVHPSSTRR